MMSGGSDVKMAEPMRPMAVQKAGLCPAVFFLLRLFGLCGFVAIAGIGAAILSARAAPQGFGLD
jgi:hypothetical protein